MENLSLGKGGCIVIVKTIHRNGSQVYNGYEKGIGKVYSFFFLICAAIGAVAYGYTYRCGNAAGKPRLVVYYLGTARQTNVGVKRNVTLGFALDGRAARGKHYGFYGSSYLVGILGRCNGCHEVAVFEELGKRAVSFFSQRGIEHHIRFEHRRIVSFGFDV